MRSLFIAGMILFVCSSVAFGAQPAQPNEHLKDVRPFIGTWRFEGPSPEGVEGYVEKGSQCTIQFSWRWILDKQAVMQDLQVEFEGNKRVSQKELISWNAAEEKIVIGGMNSIGVVHLGTIQLDPQAKTMTVVTEGVNGKGEKASAESLFTKVDKDTMTFKRLAIEGSIVEGPSPVYTLKRVKRSQGKKAAK